MKISLKRSWPAVLVVMFFLLIIFPLPGCSSKRTFNTEFGSLTTEQVGMNRNDAWAKVQSKRADLAIEWLKKNQEEAKLKVAEMSRTTFVLDTPEKIMAYTNAQLTKSLGDAVVALAKKDESSELEALIKSDPMPKSEFAEGAEAVGGIILGVTSSPTAVATSVGYMVGSTARAIAKGNGDHAVTYGDNSGVTQTKATASKSSTATVGAAAGSTEKASTAASVNPAHWNECITTTGGVRPSDADINGCMVGYGYDSTICDGGICIGGVPYSG